VEKWRGDEWEGTLVLPVWQLLKGRSQKEEKEALGSQKASLYL
jgi:hypothetical protein